MTAPMTAPMTIEELLAEIYARGRTLYGEGKPVLVHVFQEASWSVSVGTIVAVSEDLIDALETVLRRCDRLIAQGEKDNAECDAEYQRERAMAGAP